MMGEVDIEDENLKGVMDVSKSHLQSDPKLTFE